MKQSDSYEANLKELETIVERLESEAPSLEEGVDLYRRGVQLHKKLSAMLTQYQGKIEMIREEDGLLKNE